MQESEFPKMHHYTLAPSKKRPIISTQSEVIKIFMYML